MIAQLPAAVALLAETPPPPRSQPQDSAEGAAFEQALHTEDAANPDDGADPAREKALPSTPAKPRRRTERAGQDDSQPGSDIAAQAQPPAQQAQTDRNFGAKVESVESSLDSVAEGGAGHRGKPLLAHPPQPAISAAAAVLPEGAPATVPALAGAADVASQTVATLTLPVAAEPTLPAASVSAPGAFSDAARVLMADRLPRGKDGDATGQAPDQPEDPGATPTESMAVTLRAPAPTARPSWSQAASVLMWQAGAATKGAADAQSAPHIAPTASAPTESGPEREQTGPVDRPALHPALQAAGAPAMPQAMPVALAVPEAASPVTAPAGADPAILPRPFHPMIAAIAAQSAHPIPAKSSGEPTELILHPAELGRIRFALSGAGDQLTIAITAENRDTLSMLQRHIPALQAELQREGLGQANLAFSGWGGEGSARQDAPASPPPGFWPDDAADLPALLPTDLRPAPLTGGGLDLRL